MDSDDIFLCKQCGLPIRSNPALSECFTCENCAVCQRVTDEEILGLQRRLLDLLCETIAQYYQYRYGRPLSQRFRQAVQDKLRGESNPAEAKISAIKRAIAHGGADEHMLRQIAASERVLAEFFYIGGRRRRLVNSPTILRHWVALVKRMEELATKHRDPQLVLENLGRRRYDLNLVRLAKLMGDNPVPVIRDPSHYEKRQHHEHESRANHFKKHLTELVNETSNMRPPITDDWKTILRFAGNACFITEWDEVIEFRASHNKRLCKYLLKDEILILVDDLWFLNKPGSQPLAELVTIYPKRIAADNLMKELCEHRYIPNCVDVTELAEITEQVQKELHRR